MKTSSSVLNTHHIVFSHVTGCMCYSHLSLAVETTGNMYKTELVKFGSNCMELWSYNTCVV